jgi:hypothetical protein
MKNLILLLCFCFAGIALNAQEFDSEPQDAFAFPLGCKVTIKLVPSDSVNFKYRVIAFDEFTEIVDVYNNSQLFSDKLEENTIELFFCIGTTGDTEEEKEKNYRTLLLLKNGAKFPLEYAADMKVYQSESFESTSVINLFPNAKSMEMWPYIIEEIALYGFKKINKK